MGHVFRSVGISVFLLASLPQIRSQVELITIEQPFQSQKLAGTVSDASGGSVMGVFVEDCDRTFKRVYASAWTDENGQFAFRRTKHGRTHYLRISKGGLDPMHITVQVTPAGDPFVRITLTVAT